jgi:hypothetical protein
MASSTYRRPIGGRCLTRSPGFIVTRSDPAQRGDQQATCRLSEAHQSIDGTTTNRRAASALKAFEPLFFNNMTLVLDRYFVHRLRMVAGKDGNLLNEVELLSDSLMNNRGVLRGGKVMKSVPDESVLKLDIGEPIDPTAADFERLSAAFFDELERKFL